jgi:hypothetical protein
MEDIVAIKATDSRGKRHFFLTWGRSFDRVDPKPLLTAVRPGLAQFGLSVVRNLDVCPTLQEASGQPYFFEALLAFSQKPIPYGKKYSAWKAACRKKILSGKDIYYLGKPVT